MLRPATPADLPRLAELLAEANDAPYDIRTVAEEKCFGRGAGGDPVVRLFGDFLGVAVTCGKALRILAVRREARGKGIGTALVRDSGAEIVAAEAGNYFTPGIWTGDPSSLRFFTSRGYRPTADTQNLVARELPQQIPAGVLQADPHDRRVLDFIEQQFGRIWRFEASRAPLLFYVEHGGQVAGFSAHEANNRGLGWFGPTGVAQELRGRGFGRRLLLASLADLRRRGYRQAVIPWTDAIDFYRKSCGAEVAERFITLRRYSPQP